MIRTNLLIGQLVLWTFVSVAFSNDSADAVPTLTPPWIDAPPVIDGTLDDPCWNDAAGAVDAFWLLDESARESETAVARVAYDNEHLYVAYRIRTDEAPTLARGSTQRDEAVWFSPNVQLFVQPSPDGGYYIFTVNSLNTQEDAKDFVTTWDARWRSAVQVDAAGGTWQVEIAIPFACFDLSQPITPEWRFNLTASHSVKAGSPQVLTWAPTFANFHAPQRFGRLMLDRKDWPAARAALNADARPQYPDQIVVTARPDESRRTRIRVESTSPDGERQVQETETGEVLSISAPQVGEYQLVVQLLDAQTSALLAERVVRAVTPPALDVWSDRSVYTDQTCAKVWARVWGSPNRSGELVIESNTVPLEFDASCQASATIDISHLPIGTHELSVRFDDAPAMKAPIALTKLPPEKGTIWFDDRGVIHKDDKPFFPIGMYYIQQHLDESLLREYVDAGFNSIVWEWSSIEGYVAALKEMSKHDLNLFLSIQNETAANELLRAYNQAAPEQRGALAERYADRAVEIVSQVAASKPTNLLGWYVQDEPNFEALPLVRRLADIVRQHDPRRPSFVVPCHDVVFGEFAKVTDMLLPDAYPGFPGGPVTKVSQFIDHARAASRGHKPVCIVLQSFFEPGGAMPTPAELRCMTYLGIVHQARGAIYFSYSYNGPMREKHPAQWAELKKLAGEIRDLGDAVFDDAGPIRIGGVSPLLNGIDARVMRREGATYLVLVNTMRQDRIDAQVTIDGVDDGVWQVVGENRSVNIVGGRFTDDFSPLAVHVYRKAVGG